jgi:mycothiol synthase
MPDSRPTSEGVIRAIPPSLRLSAAKRLVDASSGSIEQAASRFLASAPDHGIDLDLLWGAIGADGEVADVCLAVLGAGRTAMLFISRPRPGEGGDDARAACIRAAGAGLAGRFGRRVVIAQALPEPSEPWALRAFREAGFIHVGDLAYLSRPVHPADAGAAGQPWPAGVTVRPIRTLSRGSDDRRQLATAMERSYEGTLDCPELCGLRETEDVIDSHASTGRWTPALWRVVALDGRPEGCVLLNPSPALRSVELVYLGLGPDLRGRGIGVRLMRDSLALAAARRKRDGADSMTCAVDRRNAPALRLYERLGFDEIAARVALVRPLGGRAVSSTFSPTPAENRWIRKT